MLLLIALAYSAIALNLELAVRVLREGLRDRAESRKVVRWLAPYVLCFDAALCWFWTAIQQIGH
jgi:hypothetical protein